MGTKWFDFGDQAQVSLFRKDREIFLRLELSAPPLKEQLGRAWEEGWSRSPGKGPLVFDHLTDLKNLSDAEKRLHSFFPAEKVRAALIPKEIPRAEVVRKEETGQEVVQKVLEPFSPLTPSGLQNHISQSIHTALAVTGARQQAARQLPFQGDGLMVFERLAQRTNPRVAARWFGTVLRAMAIQDDEWQAMHDALMEADVSGSTEAPAIDEGVAAFVDRVDTAMKVVVKEHGGREFPNEMQIFFADLVEHLAHNVTYRAYDGAHYTPKSVPELGGNSFRAQAGISMEMAIDAKARLADAILASARAFGLPRDALFHGTEVKFLMTLTIDRRNEDVQGQAQTIVRAGHAQHLIQFSPATPGALIHEIGHKVHAMGNEHKILRAVAEHDFMRDTRRIVSALEENGLVSPRMATYLTLPHEVFARAFDAHVVAVSESRSYGGILSSTRPMPFVPEGEKLSRFMADMKTVVLENRPEKASGIEIEMERERNTGAGPSFRPAGMAM